MTTYTITITATQAAAISHACEVLARLGMGQYKDALECLPTKELRRQHAEIARLTAENEALRAAVAEAVAAERMACAELMERQHTWITNVAASALIRARGTP